MKVGDLDFASGDILMIYLWLERSAISLFKFTILFGLHLPGMGCLQETRSAMGLLRSPRSFLEPTLRQMFLLNRNSC